MRCCTVVMIEPEEIALAKHLLKFEEVLQEVAEKLYPNKLCEYLFELSAKFNLFYERCPVLKAASPEARLSRTALCAITSDTLKLTLDLLGIETLEAI
jgi:arginyl-tRNA synthetase